MRAREFVAENSQGMTISIPINITIPAGGGMPTIAAPAGEDMPDSPVMVPPLQQEIELLKQQGGKESPVINQLINQEPLKNILEPIEPGSGVVRFRGNVAGAGGMTVDQAQKVVDTNAKAAMKRRM